MSENVNGCTDGRTFLQEGCSEVSNGPYPLQIGEVNPTSPF